MNSSIAHYKGFEIIGEEQRSGSWLFLVYEGSKLLGRGASAVCSTYLNAVDWVDWHLNLK